MYEFLVNHTALFFLFFPTIPLPEHLIYFSVVMYGCESWTIKKPEHRRMDAFELWCWRRLLRVPWSARRSNQSILKEMSWMFIGRTDAETETPILCPPDVRNWLIWKDLDVGKDRRKEEKETTENEVVGWHHRLDGHEFEWALGVGDGQGGLACCSPCGRKESDITEQLNWTDRGLEDPLEEGMATDSSILAWWIPWTEEPAGYSPWGHKELDTTEVI